MPHLFNKLALADNTPEQKKVQYELQEKCPKDASDLLDRVKAGKLAGGLLGADGIGEKQDI